MKRGERSGFVLVNVLSLAVVVMLGVLAHQRLGLIATAGAVAFVAPGIILLLHVITPANQGRMHVDAATPDGALTSLGHS